MDYYNKGGAATWELRWVVAPVSFAECEVRFLTSPNKQEVSMPLKGWKCEFCSTFSDKEDLVATHEQGCCFNPKNETCYTCDSYESQGFNSFGSPSCDMKGKVPWEELDPYFDAEEQHCPHWNKEQN